MTMEQALSGFSQGLFFMLVSLFLIALAVLLIEGLALVFVTAARVLWVKIRRDLAAFNDIIDGKAPRKATVARIENGRKKFSKVAGRAAV